MNVTDLLDQLNIDYKTEGKNVSQGWIGVPCIFCGREGNPDSDFHLGINLETGYWSCWRNSQHRGKNLAQLISALSNIPYKEAQELVEQDRPIQSNFFTAVMEKLGKNRENTDVKSLEFPREFYKFCSHKQERRASNYLIRRGFSLSSHLQLSEVFGLRYCYEGEWKDRIIFPVFESNHLLTWVGRSFYDSAELKYRNLPKSESIQSVKNCLLFYDYIRQELEEVGTGTVYICEGPFDALKMNYLLPEGCYATCLFGLTLSDRQLSLLNNLDADLVLLLDREYEFDAMKIQRKAYPLHIGLQTLPNGVSDPGDMSREKLNKFLGLRRVA